MTEKFPLPIGVEANGGRRVACVLVAAIVCDAFITFFWAVFVGLGHYVGIYLALTLGGAPLLALALDRLIISRLLAEQEWECALQRASHQVRTLSTGSGELSDRLGKTLDILLSVPGLGIMNKGAIYLRGETPKGTLRLAAHRNMDLANTAMVERNQCHASSLLDPRIPANSPAPCLLSGRPENASGCRCVPLRHQGKTLGLLNIHLDPTCSRNPRYREFLEAVADALAEAIETERIRVRNAHGAAFQAMMENAPIGIWESTPDGQLRHANDSLCGMLGIELPELLKRNELSELLGERELLGEPVSTVFSEHPVSDQVRTVETTTPMVNHRHHTLKVTRIPLRENGQLTGFIGIAEDLSEHPVTPDPTESIIPSDPLTGILSGSAFQEYLVRACKTLRADDTPHALCSIDLDHFRLINDACGREAGNHLLRQLAIIYRRHLHLRAVDINGFPEGRVPTIARIGGDEFGLLLYHTSQDDALAMAHHIANMTARHRFSFGGKAYRVSCSIGVVMIEPDKSSPSIALRQADNACRVAKEKGRNQVHLYRSDDATTRRLRGIARWAPRIIEGLEQDRFVLFQQPIVPLGTPDNGKEHFEVLLRYRDDKGRLERPASFIPAAERYALMPHLDRWVIDHTFAAITRVYPSDGFRKLGHVTINLSGQTLSEPWLTERIQRHLNETNIQPEQICFEITETTAISDIGRAIGFMERMRAAGCTLALDDFGSGMSSFTYLERFPVDLLKIDGTLVRDIDTEPAKREMVQAIHRIGHFMNLKTVAEWVENDRILSILADIGVDYVQGNWLGHPTPLGTVAAVAVPPLLTGRAS